MPPSMSDPATLLEALIRHPTAQPSADERPLAGHLAAELRARGAHEVIVEEVPRHGSQGAFVYARWGRPKWLLNAHLDTVPPNDGWRADPFTPRRMKDASGERILGLGACDTKGSIAAILSALEREPPSDLAVLFSGDEEHTGTCMRAFLDGPLAKGIVRAIAFEPTSCRVGTRHRGILSIEARLVGKGGHSSGADRMPAPLAELARVAAAWADYGVGKRSEGPAGFEGLCMNIARLDGGVAFNVVPEEASLVASVRPPPGCDYPALKQNLVEIARRIAPAVEITHTVDNWPFATRDLSTFTHFPPVTSSAPIDLAYWTEAALFAQAGIDAIVYGPGSIAQAHAPEEWVPTSDLDQAASDVAELIRSIRTG